MKKKNYLLIAHYHSSGKIRDDLKKFVIEANNFFKDIILISTKLDKLEIKKIKNFAKVIIRPNYGYDFYSYKIGIQELLSSKKITSGTIFFVASSLFFVNPKKLLNFFKRKKNLDKKICGLSKSWEIEEHLQTDIFSIPVNYFEKKKFLNWWKKIKKYKKRSTIIGKYEIGFSKFLIKNDIEYDCFFKENIKDYPNSLIKKLKNRISNIFFKVVKKHKKNPTHFYWQQILNKFGILKIDLIKFNPNRINLNDFNKIFKKKYLTILKKESANN